jgi:hypothetical protein
LNDGFAVFQHCDGVMSSHFDFSLSSAS